MHYCGCKGTTKLQLLQRVFLRMLTKFLSDAVIPLGIKAKWDKSSEWYQSQQREDNNPPRISKLGMGMDFDI